MTETSTTNLVEYACSNQVATLTLNRPDRLNAFSDDLVRHLADALRRFDLDPDAQVAIICGRGRAFSSGADVHQRQLRKREEFEQHGGPQGWGANSADLLTRSVNWKPVIAAPHGYAMGLALGIVLECDLIVAEAARGLGHLEFRARRGDNQVAFEHDPEREAHRIACGAAITGFQLTALVNKSAELAPQPCGPPCSSNSSRRRNWR